jgi:hypothetical protein
MVAVLLGGGAVSTPAAADVTHVADLLLVQGGKFVLVIAEAELEPVNNRQNVLNGEPAFHFVTHLAEDCSNLAFVHVWAIGLLLELAELEKQFIEFLNFQRTFVFKKTVA